MDIIRYSKKKNGFTTKIGITFPEAPLEHLLELPPAIQKDMEFQYITERKVLYSDVDINQHMNNTRYVEWALDFIDFDKHHQCYISDLNIQYRKEIRPLEKVKLFMAENGHRYIVEGRSQEDEVYFTIEIYFRDR